MESGWIRLVQALDMLNVLVYSVAEFSSALPVGPIPSLLTLSHLQECGCCESDIMVGDCETRYASPRFLLAVGAHIHLGYSNRVSFHARTVCFRLAKVLDPPVFVFGVALVVAGMLFLETHVVVRVSARSGVP